MKAAILECAMFVQYAWAPEYKHYSVWGCLGVCSVQRHGIAGVHDYVRGYGGSSDNGITRGGGGGGGGGGLGSYLNIFCSEYVLWRILTTNVWCCKYAIRIYRQSYAND